MTDQTLKTPSEVREADIWRQKTDALIAAAKDAEAKAQAKLTEAEAQVNVLRRERTEKRRAMRRARQRAREDAALLGETYDLKPLKWADGTTDGAKGAGGEEGGPDAS